MTTLDYMVSAVIVGSLLAGLMKGFVKSVWGAVTTVIGLFLAVTLYPSVMEWIRDWVETDAMAFLAAFFLIFTGTVLVGIALGRSFRRFLEKTRLGWLDHLAGGALGFVRGWLICSVLYIGLTAFPVQSDMVAEATLAPYLLEGSEVLTYLTSEELRDQFLDEYHRLQSRWGAIQIPRGDDTK